MLIAGETARERARGQALEKSPGCGTRVSDSQKPLSALRRRRGVKGLVMAIPTAVNSTLGRVRSAGAGGRNVGGRAGGRGEAIQANLPGILCETVRDVEFREKQVNPELHCQVQSEARDQVTYR